MVRFRLAGNHGVYSPPDFVALQTGAGFYLTVTSVRAGGNLDEGGQKTFWTGGGEKRRLFSIGWGRAEPEKG